MKKLALILLAAASLLGTVGIASAQWYGGGYYPGDPNRMPNPYYRERYREQYYDDDRYYRRRHYRRGYNYNPCGEGWSLQDGRCKPYRGY